MASLRASRMVPIFASVARCSSCLRKWWSTSMTRPCIRDAASGMVAMCRSNGASAPWAFIVLVRTSRHSSQASGPSLSTRSRSSPRTSRPTPSRDIASALDSSNVDSTASCVTRIVAAVSASLLTVSATTASTSGGSNSSSTRFISRSSEVVSRRNVVRPKMTFLSSVSKALDCGTIRLSLCNSSRSVASQRSRSLWCLAMRGTRPRPGLVVIGPSGRSESTSSVNSTNDVEILEDVLRRALSMGRRVFHTSVAGVGFIRALTTSSTASRQHAHASTTSLRGGTLASAESTVILACPVASR
mmetsp:Transcript_25256/g.65980  ORF Transcript_25256/g.65980 Transcript_25256/m.65980 type:complete len:301 (-) Transcript_25256:1562-2464(-)